MNKLYIIPVMIYLGVFFMDDIFTPEIAMVRKHHSKTLEENFIDFHDNGVKQVNANFKKSKLSGAWMSWFNNGIKCDSGRFSGNIPDGEWKSWYPDGKTRVVWHFNSKKLIAVKDELLRQPRNKMFIISERPVSEAVQYFRVDYWYGDQKNDYGVKLRSDLVSTPHFTRQELLKKVDDNTVNAIEKYRPPFTEALLHGNYTSYYPNGSVKEDGVFLNGMREGAWEEFDTKGIRSRGSYKHNIKHGEWRKYSTSNKLVSFSRYNHGVIVEEYQF